VTDPIVVIVSPASAVVVNLDPTGALTGGTIRSALEGATPAAVALVTGTAVTVASWLVDSYGSRGGEIVLTKTDGSRIRYGLQVTHDGVVSGADATAATVVPGIGTGTHADFTPGAWLTATVSGVTTAQLVNLKVTAAANGASWTATFVADFLKRA
jgi:hypothetical protein